MGERILVPSGEARAELQDRGDMGEESIHNSRVKNYVY